MNCAFVICCREIEGTEVLISIIRLGMAVNFRNYLSCSILPAYVPLLALDDWTGAHSRISLRSAF